VLQPIEAENRRSDPCFTFNHALRSLDIDSVDFNSKACLNPYPPPAVRMPGLCLWLAQWRQRLSSRC
jgi:hypothetical protein